MTPGQPVYVAIAANAKRLMDASLHSERMAAREPEYWHRDYYRTRAAGQRHTAWEFLSAARTAKKKGFAG